MAESQRAYHNRRLEALRSERNDWEALWQEYNDYIMPGRMRLTQRERRGSKQMQKIVDETGLLSFRVMRSGMMSGQTSPARPWFRLTTFDPDLKEYGPVKEYLYQVEQRMRQIMQRSNLYNVLHGGYGDLGQFGQMAALLVGAKQNYMRGIPMLTGQYWLAQNQDYRVDTLYRLVYMTVEQVVGKFVAKPDGGMDWDRASTTVKNLYDKGNYDEWVRVYHAVEPRKNRDVSRLDKRNKPFLSNYWEDGQSADKLLEESGFDDNRILAPRWETTGEDVYGSGHPGALSLPAIKMLQVEQKDKGEAITKMHKPPMVGPTALKNNKSSILPGSITYVDSVGQNSSYRPAFEVHFDVSGVMADIQEVQKRIDRVWYADLFMAITQMEGVQPRNVMELTARKEEQLLQLGPVIDRQQNELLGPIIDIVYQIGVDEHLFPPAPPEVQGQNLKVEYISVLAQAQKAVATGAIERGVGFVGNIAGIDPSVLDKVDFDQTVDEYFDMVGTPPTIIRSDDAVAKMRKDREASQNAMANAQMAKETMPAVKQGADAAQVLAETSQLPGSSDLLRKLGISG
jgi:hypothetical protein